MTERKLGPNMQRLLALRVAREAIPDGGGFASGLEFFKNPARIAHVSQKALEWCDQAIAAVRASPDNPYGDDEETIAGEILKRAEKRNN